MAEEELSAELEKLHAMLAEQDEFSEDLSSQLRKVADDIESVLGESDAETPEGTSAQIDDLIRDFDAHHPTLTDLLRRIAHGLSNLGI